VYEACHASGPFPGPSSRQSGTLSGQSAQCLFYAGVVAVVIVAISGMLDCDDDYDNDNDNHSDSEVSSIVTSGAVG
jgi:hypothetical protein